MFLSLDKIEGISDFSDKSDEEILACSIKDPSVFSVILERYEKAFLRKVKPIVGSMENAEDVVQETFTKIYLNASRFEIQEGATFKAWAYKILLNTSFTNYQKYKKSKSISFTPEMEEIIPDTKSRDFEKEELKDQVISAFVRMPDIFSKVLRLYFIENFSQKEIAEMENVSIGAIKTRIHRAKKEFKDVATELI